MSIPLDNYYRDTSPQYNSLRLDSITEIDRHCSWFINSKNVTGKLNLEIGCGTGRYSYQFTQKGLISIGLDRSTAQISEAVKSVPALLSETTNAPFPQGSFNFISLILMLHQLSFPQLTTLIKQCHYLLSPNGFIWVKTCGHDDLKKRPFNVYFPSSLEVNTARYPKITQLTQIALNNGFQLTRKVKMGDSYTLKGSQLIYRFEQKHNSTLYLIPTQEFEVGLKRMKSNFARDIPYNFTHYHTLIEYSKSQSQS